MSATQASADAPAASIFGNTKTDIPAGLVVFLVALPLCLGIALACKVPLSAGLISGVVGGLVIPLISRSPLSVCGPAAGLTTIVLAGVSGLGSFPAFLAAVVVAGAMQVAMGFLKAGGFVGIVPSSVIKGMLAAIGVTLLLKQTPYALGYRAPKDGATTLAETGLQGSEHLWSSSITPTAMLISLISLVILFTWEKNPLSKNRWIPSALVVVVVGTLINEILKVAAPSMALSSEFLVALPAVSSVSDAAQLFIFPDFSFLAKPEIYTTAATLAAVASIETLLSLEAVDKLDPWRRRSPADRELIAQGVANMASGLLGGLPVTSVIVRSSANVSAGARDRLSAMVHGVLLLIAAVLGAVVLNHIPLACLAAVLLQVGYKLTRPALIRSVYHLGYDQFIPFAVTLIAILATDLLRGVILGFVFGVAFVLLRNAKGTVQHYSEQKDGKSYHVVKFGKDATFVSKPTLQKVFDEIPSGVHVQINGTGEFIDFDVQELIANFMKMAPSRDLHVELKGIHLADGAGGGH